MAVSPFSSRKICCTVCGAPFRLGQFSSDGRLDCPSCGDAHWVHVAPAFLRDAPEAAAIGRAALDDEATCYYHPDRQAVAVCDASGRFMCELCKVDFNGRVYCMEAFEQLRRDGTDPDFAGEAHRLDRAAFLLAALPPFSIVFYFLSYLTAPVAFFLASYSLFQKPRGPLPWGRGLAILALGLSSANIVLLVLESLGIVNLL